VEILRVHSPEHPGCAESGASVDERRTDWEAYQRVENSRFAAALKPDGETYGNDGFQGERTDKHILYNGVNWSAWDTHGKLSERPLRRG